MTDKKYIGIRKVFSKALKETLTRRGLLPGDLANKVPISLDTINKYLDANKELDITDLQLICNELNINLLRIFDSKRCPEISYRVCTMPDSEF